MALPLDGTDTKVSFQAAYRGLKDPQSERLFSTGRRSAALLSS